MKTETAWRSAGFGRALVGAGLSAVLVSCGPGDERAGDGGVRDGRVRVAATTTMVADLVAAVGGDRIELFGLMGPGVDPHLYKPAAADVNRLRDAEVIFYNGLMLEGRMAELFDRMAAQGRRVHAVAGGLDEADLVMPEGSAGHPDPHVWFDPRLWGRCAGVVAEALAEADPEGAGEYRERGEAFAGRCDELFRWAEARLAGIPESGRVLVTSHDAFNYFGRAFGFEVIGVVGISTTSEAGLADVTRTVDLVKGRGIKAIFVESSVSRATIDRIGRDAGVSVGGELFSDAMGTPGEWVDVGGGESVDVGTYAGMFKANVHTIAGALE